MVDTGEFKNSQILSNLSLGRNDNTVKVHHIADKAAQQLGTVFGCLPVFTIKLFNCEPAYYEKIPDIMQTHMLVR